MAQPPSPTSQLKTKFEDLYLESEIPTRKDEEQLQQFHCFALLPTELRLKIYTLSLPSPRLVPIYYTSPTRSPPTSPSYPYTHGQNRVYRPAITSFQNQNHNHNTGLTSPSPIPSLLHVNHESRSLTQKHYTLSFSLPYTQPKIWFSTPNQNQNQTQTQNQDILYIPRIPSYLGTIKHYTTLLSLLPSSSVQSVTRLAVHEDLFLGQRKVRQSWDSGVCDLGLPWEWDEDLDENERVVEERLMGFWRDVKRVFEGVREVWVVGGGREGDVGMVDDGEKGEEGLEIVSVGGDKGREGFVEKVRRVVGVVEEESGGNWKAPRWWVLRVEGGGMGC